MGMTGNDSKGVGRCGTGCGPEGTHGHIEIGLRRLEPGAVEVIWAAGLDAETEKQVSRYVRGYLRWYIEGKDLGLRAEILHVGTDPVRRNDHERAAILAIWDALGGLGLQPPMIFLPPDEDDEIFATPEVDPAVAKNFPRRKLPPFRK